MKIRKAVIPVAGFGTRFLPATRSVPKVMFPVLDVPVIHYAVEEAVKAGIEHVIFVVSPRQEAIAAYFDRVPDLESALEQQHKETLLDRMRQIPEMVQTSYVEQREQLGLGHAVLLARSVIGDEPFAVLLPDDVIWSEAPTIGSMLTIFGEHRGSVIAVRQVPDEMVSSLGIINPRPLDDGLYEVAELVEKPSLDRAPSNLAIIGRYVLTPEVFDLLERTPPGAVGEVQLTDAISMLLETQKVYAHAFPGTHFDVGTPPGLLKASVYAALQREDLADDLRAWIASVTRE